MAKKSESKMDKTRKTSASEGVELKQDIVYESDNSQIEESVTEEPVVETPVVEPAIIEESATEESIVETPIVETPIVESTVIENPVVEAPVVETPVVETPIIEETVVETPVTENSIDETPSDGDLIDETKTNEKNEEENSKEKEFLMKCYEHLKKFNFFDNKVYARHFEKKVNVNVNIDFVNISDEKVIDLDSIRLFYNEFKFYAYSHEERLLVKFLEENKELFSK